MEFSLPPFPEHPCDPSQKLAWIAWGNSCAAMGMERAAVIASSHSTEPIHPDVPFADQDDAVTGIAHWQAQNIAAAILAAIQQEPK